MIFCIQQTDEKGLFYKLFSVLLKRSQEQTDSNSKMCLYVDIYDRENRSRRRKGADGLEKRRPLSEGQLNVAW